MKRYTLLLLALLLIPAIAPAQVSAAAESEADQAITKVRAGLVDSFNKGDIDRMLTWLDTNAVVTWQNGEVSEGPAAVKAYYERMMKGDHPVVRKITADPKVLGRHVQEGWAVSWGNLNDYFVLTDGRELPLNSRFTATLAKRSDRWLVSAFHVSVNAFDNPIMGLAISKTLKIAGFGGVVAGGIIAGIIVKIMRQRKTTSK